MDEIFRDNAYERDCRAKVTAVDGSRVRLDKTVFYPMGGGQPGDTGRLIWSDGTVSTVVDTRKAEDGGDIDHVLADDAPIPPTGTDLTAEIDWNRRHRHMRMHTALHLLCSLVEGEVTGGQIGADKSRLDFNIPAGSVDKLELTEKLNALVLADHPVRSIWISDEDLARRDDLVRTMSVKPPTGDGRVRLLEIAGVDLQACGGTHVARTGEIGTVEVTKIENKGKQNRRINIALKG